MTAPILLPPPKPKTKVFRLPDISETSAPGWQLTRRAVTLALGLFAALLSLVIISLFLVTIRTTIDGDGYVEPQLVVPVRALESGIIDRVLVSAGDTVKPGQALALLDSITTAAGLRDLDAQVALSRAELDRLRAAAPLDSQRAEDAISSATARVDQARTSLRQVMVAFMIKGDADSIAHASGSRIHVGLDGPSAVLRAALADLASARVIAASGRLSELDIRHKELEVARLKRSVVAGRVHLQRQVVRSTTTGVVLTDGLELLRGSQVAPGQTLLEVGETSHWRAEVLVSERDVYRISIGDTADVEIPAFASEVVDRVRGRVVSVARQLASQSAVGTTASTTGYRVVIQLDSIPHGELDEGALRRGYAVRAKIVTRSQKAFGALVSHVRDASRGVLH